MSETRVAEIFIDTNVLLYAISTDDNEAGKASIARGILQNADWAWSAQIAAEFVRASTSSKKRQPVTLSQARVFIQTWCAFPMLAIDEALVLDAISIAERFQISYFDAQVVAGAKRLRCQHIYTLDLNHGQDYGGVTVHNPFR
jgi:predicted nucleic acid-binding protein